MTTMNGTTMPICANTQSFHGSISPRNPGDPTSLRLWLLGIGDQRHL